MKEKGNLKLRTKRKIERMNVREATEQEKLPFGSSATYLAPYRERTNRERAPIVITPSSINKSVNAIKFGAEEEFSSSSSSSSSSSKGSDESDSQISLDKKKRRQKASAIKRITDKRKERKADSTQSLQSLQSVQSLKEVQNLKEIHELTTLKREHEKREEEMKLREKQLLNEIEFLHDEMKSSNIKRRKWREGKAPPFIPGRNREKLMEKDESYTVPSTSFEKLISPWADIYTLRKNAAGIDDRPGPNPWHTCKYCPCDCWHDQYNTIIAVGLFLLVAVSTYFVFGKNEQTLWTEIRKTFCSINAIFWRR